MHIYVDADACPVKDEVYRVAARHGLPVTVVAAGYIRVPQDPMIERVAAGNAMDAADDWIAERVRPGDVVITADVPLASRCVKAGAEVIAPDGRPFSEQSIGMTLAVRNLMHDLRSAGETTRGPRPFSPRDRSAFLSASRRDDPARATGACGKDAMPPPLLQLRDIALTFGGTPLLDGVELSVSAGERVCLVGRNGSGKSTLLRIAAGLVEADRGTRFLQPGATIRYLPQEPDLSGCCDHARLCRGRARPGRRSRTRRAICSSSSGSPATRIPRSSPAARRAARRWRACSRRLPTSCCSTSRPIISTSPPSNGSSRSWRAAAARW